MSSKTPEKKPLTEKQKQILRKTIVKMNIGKGNVVAYCIANKQSKSGLFSNERLLLMHSKEKSIRYYTNIPSEIPFTSEQQIKEGKEKIFIDNVNKFKCQQVKGKNSTLMIEWEVGKEKNTWIFGMGTPKVMHEWIALVEEMCQGKLKGGLTEEEILQEKKKEEQKRKELEEEEERRKRKIEEEKKRNENEMRRKEEEERRRIEKIKREEEEKQMERIYLINKQQQEEKEEQLQRKEKEEESKRVVASSNREKNNRFSDQPSLTTPQYMKNNGVSESQPVHILGEDKSRRAANFFKSEKRKNAKETHNKWNQIWCTVKNPIEIYEQFSVQCRETALEIISELSFLKSDRTFTPLKIKSPYSVYVYDGIEYQLHCFSEEKNLLENEGREGLPILFDQDTYYQVKREFYNFNYIISMTGNRGFVKVPLSYYLEYQGIVVVCKALISDSFTQVSPRQYERQLQSLEAVLKLKFHLNSLSLHRESASKYIILSNLEELIPALPLQSLNYFRKQLLSQTEEMIDDRQKVLDLYQNLTSTTIPQFIQRLESLEFWIINSKDLLSEMHKVGISACLLNQLYSATNCIYYRKLFISEMVAVIFSNIIRSQLNNAVSTFPATEIDNLTSEMASKILLNCIHVMIDELFSYSSRSEAIWRTIVKQTKEKYKVVVSKEDILPTYLLGAIIYKNGLESNFKSSEFSRDINFFVKEKTIPQSLFVKFIPIERRYNLEMVSSELQVITEILSDEPSPENFDNMVQLLRLKTEKFPSFCKEIKEEIKTYMCNFVPFEDDEEYLHLDLYDSLQTEPHTFVSTKITLLAIKWSIKKKNEELASKIFEVKFQENIFWASEFNPAISEFYDFFSLYYASVINFDEAVKLGKSSLINIIKILGANSLPVSDKHYQLGNIFFKAGKKEDALKQYLKTKQILQHHKQTSIPEYGVILLKLSLLYLNFGKIIDSVGYSLETLKIIEQNGGNEEDEIETFEILSRAYEITRKKMDLINVGALCTQKFNQTDNPKIFERMIKIALMPRLSSIHPQDSKSLLNIFTKLQAMQSKLNYMEAFSYLRFRAEEEVIMKRVISYIENISDINEEINRRDLYRKHRSLNYETQTQAAETLVVLETIAVMVGYNFLIGSIRENFYG